MIIQHCKVSFPVLKFWYLSNFLFLILNFSSLAVTHPCPGVYLNFIYFQITSLQISVYAETHREIKRGREQ